MSEPRTGAERYVAREKEDAEFRAAHDEATRRIRLVDELVRSLDDARRREDLSKAELARRAGIQPEAVRRLFSLERPNPTASTLAALADALGLELVAARRPAHKNGRRRPAESEPDQKRSQGKAKTG